MRSDEQMLEDVVNYRGDVPRAIVLLREALGDRDEDAGQHVLTIWAARAVTMMFHAGTVNADDCRTWARFLLGRRDVALMPGSEYEMLEFLEDWSFPDVGGPIDADSVSVWQLRFDSMEFG
ncbi:hypothetical protein E3O23_11835 [Cryobacterium tagatosivorans]|uniref:Uncharacterized protein n=2 Tax=Cryobacterium tagatosivorans TaxID=1259199 RepID=A0A4R8UCK1_9MICO|nr:hypothetical protein E3O23_11835 [Cryobacterium tagatosivorans]